MLRGWAAGAAMLLLALPVVAQVNDVVTTATVTGTSSCAFLPQNNFRKALTLDATAASVNLGYCEGACTAAIGSAGTSTIFAGTTAYWPAGSAPRNAFCFIAVSGSQALTIREGL